MELSSTHLKRAFLDFISRFHVLIFAVVILGGLVACMILLNNVILQSGDAGGYTPSSTNTSFDQQTIDRIKQLHTATDQNTDTLDLSGRISPFVD